MTLYRDLIGRFNAATLRSGDDSEGLLAVPIDGRQFGDHTVEYSGDPKFDTRFKPAFVEKLALATMAASLRLSGDFFSLHGVQVPPQWGAVERAKPDFAYVENGRFQYFIEMALLASPEQEEMRDISADINAQIRYILDDEAVSSHLQGAFFEIVLPWGKGKLSRFEAAQEAVSLATQYARSDTISATLELVPKEYPLLASVGARIYMSRTGPAHVGVSHGAFAFDSTWYLSGFRQTVDSRAKRYHGTVDPVRLFVFLVDSFGETPNVGALRNSLTHSISPLPFESVVLGFGTRAVDLLKDPAS